MHTESTPRRALRRAAMYSLLPVAALVAGFTVPRIAAPVNAVTITADDFAFVGPDTLKAGTTRITLRNRGKEMHHVQLVLLKDGHSMKDFFDALKAGGPPPAWAMQVGGPNAPAPGRETAATLDMVAGRYALLCFIPSPDGTPHIMKGMAKEMVVVDAKRGGVVQAGAPSSAGVTSTMTLNDYGFALSSPLEAGRNVVRVVNSARQPHEVLVARLAPGKTARDLAAWVEKQAGPPPGMPLGGTTGLDQGAWNELSLSLTPGNYALLCFLPDAKDGKPHVMHGMMSEFTIK